MASSTPTLDLTPSQLNIRFQRGSTFAPLFFYLGPSLEVISLAGAAAKMQAKAAYADTTPLTGWDLTTQNGGLNIIQGDVTVPAGTTLPDGTITDTVQTIHDAWAVQPSVVPAVTAAVTWANALYDCDIILNGVNIPLVKGTLTPSAEITL
jgi:hypothetical protein